jgi:hypothetical protein
VKVPSAWPVHSTAPPPAALRERMTIVSHTMKHDSLPMPNWPRKSPRGRSKMSRFELRPTVASRSATSASVSPMPSSRRTNSSDAALTGVIRMRPPPPSSARRAAIASTAFWRSSRRNTRGLE